MASYSPSPDKTPATPPPSANTSDKQDMKIALGLERKGREDCMTKKLEIEVSTETDAFMRRCNEDEGMQCGGVSVRKWMQKPLHLIPSASHNHNYTTTSLLIHLLA